MGKLFERQYYKIEAAASEIGCEVDDLIHWASIGQIRLGVLISLDELNLEDYFYFRDETGARVDPLKAGPVRWFEGFAYVNANYFKALERLGGNLTFNCFELANGCNIGIKPYAENNGHETRSLDGIYIHSNDLRELLSLRKSASADKPLKTTERTTLLTIIAALCDYSAIKHQERGAASQIAKYTEEIGAPVDADTVRRVLSKIPDAMETRMK